VPVLAGSLQKPPTDRRQTGAEQNRSRKTGVRQEPKEGRAAVDGLAIIRLIRLKVADRKRFEVQLRSTPVPIDVFETVAGWRRVRKIEVVEHLAKILPGKWLRRREGEGELIG
jgi:hypothetical protein